MRSTCLHCGKSPLHAGKGWTSLVCKECHDIHSEDLKNNQAAQLEYKAGKITKEECLSRLKYRIKEMYYSDTSTLPAGTNAEAQEPRR